jgi:formylglycine-generating enzyme required for sulfatase activity
MRNAIILLCLGAVAAAPGCDGDRSAASGKNGQKKPTKVDPRAELARQAADIEALLQTRLPAFRAKLKTQAQKAMNDLAAAPGDSTRALLNQELKDIARTLVALKKREAYFRGKLIETRSMQRALERGEGSEDILGKSMEKVDALVRETAGKMEVALVREVGSGAVGDLEAEKELRRLQRELNPDPPPPPPLTESERLLRSLDAKESALRKTLGLFTKESPEAQQARNDVRTAQDKIKTLLVDKLLPVVQKLRAEEQHKGTRMLPAHPEMRALAAKVAAAEAEMKRLAYRIRDALTKEQQKLLGVDEKTAPPPPPPPPPPPETVEELERKLDEAEEALAKARRIYTPQSEKVRTAHAAVRAVQERLRSVLMQRLVPALRKLEAERKRRSRDMLPTHPQMRALSAKIAAAQSEVMRVSFRVQEILSDEERKSLGVGKGLVLDLGRGVRMEFVAIPAGQFAMGSTKGSDDEKPVHTVRITKPFYMGKYEVTQEQWEAVMGDNPSHFKGAKNPVEKVSWNDCQQFLRKLKAKVPGGLACRLPTEAEWEYACRAGSTTKYSFGESENDLGDHAWYSKNSGNKTHPVGQKKHNAWGLYDMHGNVWEWCHDWYADSYPIFDQTDPTGPTSGEYRVLRGGCWFSNATYCRSAIRNYSYHPSSRLSYNGFRVVLRGGVD